MASTGEVACIGDNYYEALLMSMLSVGYTVPSKEKGILISAGPSHSRAELLEAAQMLRDAGYKIYATAGSSAFFEENGIPAQTVHWPDSVKKPNVLELIEDHAFDLVINIPKNFTERELRNGYLIRRKAVDHNIPLITNARLASAFIYAVCKINLSSLAVKAWQEY